MNKHLQLVVLSLFHLKSAGKQTAVQWNLY